MAGFGKRFADWFTGRDAEKGPVSVGGQAVMEGVMMKGPKYMAVAVRDASGRIQVKRKPVQQLSKKYPFLGWPILRGVVNFIVMLVSGMKTLMESAEMAGGEVEEPSAFEKKVAKALHMKPDDVMMIFAVVLALVMAIGLFFMIPTALETLIKKAVHSRVLVNLCGGVIRILVFLAYVLLVSRLKEIRRVFQYHGAEHKSVFCYENGKPLTVENAQKFSTLHPRCGTSFLVIVMVISILVFTFLGADSSNVFKRMGSRLLLLPLVAGVSYEVLRALGRAKETPLVRALRWPGLMVQKITTAQPDDSMVEVALCSLKYALDMPDYLPKEPEAPAPAEEPAAPEEPAPAEEPKAE